MTLRVRRPNTPPKDVDLGPGNGRAPRDGWFRRLSIDEQLALASKAKR